MYSEYKNIQKELQKNTCLESSRQCEQNIDFNLKNYCSSNDNLLTEDACYHWYTQNIYNNVNDVNIYTKDEEDKKEISELLMKVCNKYSYHPKCKCMTEIGNNIDSKFSAGSTYNPSLNYPYYCIFQSCQTKQTSDSPKNFTPYIPLKVYKDNTPCPKNVCSIILKDNNITLENDSQLNLTNICNNQNNKDDKDEKDDKDNSSSASVFDVFAGKLGIEVNTLYVIIGVFSLIMLVLIIMIVYYIKQINHKKDWQYRVKAARY